MSKYLGLHDVKYMQAWRGLKEAEILRRIDVYKLFRVTFYFGIFRQRSSSWKVLFFSFFFSSIFLSQEPNR